MTFYGAGGGTEAATPKPSFLLDLTLAPPPGTVAGAVPTAQEDGTLAWQAPATTTPASGEMSIAHANTGNSGELVAALEVDTAKFAVVLSLPVGEVLAGDLFMAFAEVQVTNDLGYNCMVTGYLILGQSPDATAGIEVSENNGANVTPAQHHLTVPKVGTYQADSNYGTRWLNFVSRAASTAAQAGDRLAVDQDYGRLSVVRVRGAEPLVV